MPRKQRARDFRIGPYIVNGKQQSPNLYIFWNEGRGKRKGTGLPVSTTSEDEAQATLAAFILEYLAPPKRKRHEMPIATAFDDYLREHGPAMANPKRPAMSRATILRYFGEHETVDKITPAAVRGFITWRGKHRNNRGEPIKLNSIRRELQDLKAALNHAHKEDRLESVPYIQIPAATEPKDRWLTPEEAKRIYDALSPHIQAFMLLALLTGQRKGALLGLKWEQVSFDLRRIYFQPSGQKQTNKRKAIVPMCDMLYRLLAAIRKRRPHAEYVILKSTGKPYTGEVTGFRNACRKLGMDDVTPHTLRHTAASWLYQDGIAWADIQLLLAHKMPGMTGRYTHHGPDYLQTAVNALEKRCAVFARNHAETSVLRGVKTDAV